MRRLPVHLSMACILGLTVAVATTASAITNTQYQFSVPLAPFCLNGTFPVTLNTMRGTLTLSSGAKGVLSGQLSIGALTQAVTGKEKLKNGVAAITLTSSGAGGKLSFKGSVNGTVLQGVVIGQGAAAGLSGVLKADLSSASSDAAEVLVNLIPGAKGVLTGSGVAILCNTTVTFVAKGKVAGTTITLKLAGSGFSFSGKGTAQGDDFVMTWTAKNASGTATGSGLQIIPGPNEQKENTVAPLSPIFVDPPSPFGGGTATLTVNVPGATQITLTTSGEGCGAFTGLTQSGSQLVDGQIVGGFGPCVLNADVQTGTNTVRYSTSFNVLPTGLILPALTVPGSLFLPGSLPSASGTTNDPNIGSIDSPGALINGGTAQLRIHLSNPLQAPNIKNVLVHVTNTNNFDGYWLTPAVVTGSTVIVNVRLDANAATPPTEDMQIALEDSFGDIGSFFALSLPTREVGTGIVQVSLSWDALDDLDLHVVDPSGEEIYYASRDSASGGTLDLDSNPACNIDGINNENIVWTNGAPVGEYIVRVDYFEDCQGVGDNYTVTTTFCNQIQTFTGSFAAGTDDGGSLGAGVEVTRFTVDCVSNTSVSGTATYEKFAQTLSGLATVSTMVPIGFAKVEVRRSSDNVTLGKGDTQQDGTFDIQFKNDGTPGYYVVVMAQQNNDKFREQVQNNAGQIYSVRSAGSINEQTTPQMTGLQIQALATPRGAAAGTGPGPAFNIFDLGILGQTFLRKATNSTPPLLTWLFTKGDGSTCKDSVSCYHHFDTMDLISVLSSPEDPDEYDDLVLLHEFGHYFQFYFGRDDSLGGAHEHCDPIDPLLAWSEGAATWFGCYVKGTSRYLDTNPITGVGVSSDIENLDTCVALGTSDGSMTGLVSEARVSGILWDLSDASNESGDTVTNPNGVLRAIFYLHSSHFADRGVTGADLVDFLDGWFCVGNADRGTDTSGVQGIVTGLHGFPYDFAGPVNCQ